jgi:hypothetical protein
LANEIKSTPEPISPAWIKKAAEKIVDAYRDALWGHEDDVAAFIEFEYAKESECLMADCENPQEHFCFQHCMEVYATKKPSVTSIARHCEDARQGCCLQYPTPAMPHGWCVCACGKCAVAKYAATPEYGVEAGWSSEWPTVDGFYWMRTERTRALPVEIKGDEVWMTYQIGCGYKGDYENAEFLPLPVPPEKS